jgi:hypothetical protein
VGRQALSTRHYICPIAIRADSMDAPAEPGRGIATPNRGHLPDTITKREGAVMKSIKHLALLLALAGALSAPSFAAETAAAPAAPAAQPAAPKLDDLGGKPMRGPMSERCQNKGGMPGYGPMGMDKCKQPCDKPHCRHEGHHGMPGMHGAGPAMHEEMVKRVETLEKRIEMLEVAVKALSAK